MKLALLYAFSMVCLNSAPAFAMSKAAPHLGGEHHRLMDQILGQGEALELRAELRYGLLDARYSKGEAAGFYRKVGARDWSELGISKADRHGRIHFAAGPVLPVGTYETRLAVEDGTEVTGVVSVVTPGTKIVVFDIDGTLTTTDEEFIHQILHPGYDPKMFTDGDTVVKYWADRGYQILFMTGRLDRFTDLSRQWLSDRGIAPAPLVLADGFKEFLPTQKGVALYKQETLQELQKRLGSEIKYAFGNATTDICAYAKAGIPTTQTYIIGKHTGEACPGFAAPNAVTSYTDLLTHMPE